MIDYATLDSIREKADSDDSVYGDTYYNIMRLCDEVEFLKEELALYKDKLMATSTGRNEMANNSGFIEMHEKEIHQDCRKPQRMRCYTVDFVVGSGNPRLAWIEHVGVCAEDSIHAMNAAKKSLLEGRNIDSDPIMVKRTERI